MLSTVDDIHSWLIALGSVPSRGTLARLERDGVIVNVKGFPALTAFGEVVRSQIDDSIIYLATRPELFEDSDGRE